jgi:hypothetical protein
MACPIIIRRHDGFQSYLVLDDNPRELLRHPGFREEYSVRPWDGSPDPYDAREDWAEMLGEEQDNFIITDSEHREYCQESPCWDEIPMWPKR